MNSPAMIGNPFSPGNIPDGFRQGIAARSKYRIKAPAHLLVPDGGEWKTWCTAAPGMVETPLGAPCRKCLALLREYHDENGEVTDGGGVRDDFQEAVRQGRVSQGPDGSLIVEGRSKGD